ncbi:MAG: NAD(P)/FAD-dependent oxidoreductase, partial [Actinobacteria bacterium]|nr:NAD(P)/FAD-dependent oxidoreductase [Actinomycetota bacterium]
MLPKYIGGIPTDQLGLRGSLVSRTLANPRVPFRVQQRLFEQKLKQAVGDPTTYGLPKPDHRLGEAHPTISGRILDRIAHGRVTPKPNIAELQGDRVKFADGSVEQAEVIVYCTGYK